MLVQSDIGIPKQEIQYIFGREHQNPGVIFDE